MVDGQYEGSWDTEFENTETLTNTATFYGTIAESNNNEEWGYTEPTIIWTTVSYNSSASVKAPLPTNKKYIVKITTPDNTVYDNTTWLPNNIPVASEIEYAVTMDFPNVNFINAKVIDALPLIVWPNDQVYDYAFQTNSSLLDINWNSIEINDNDNDGISDSIFNWLNLTSTGWISETPANNIEFDLWTWTWNKTFAMTFKVKVLDVKPDGINNWLAPLKNVSFASVNDDQALQNNLAIQDVELDLWIPELEITKTMSGSDIEAWSDIDYSVEIKNIWTETAYIENLIDTLPSNLDLQIYTITGSGFTVNSPSLTQSWNILTIYFNTGSTNRSELPKNTSVLIDYSVKANSGLLINNISKTNTISLDYYASDTANSNDLNNYGPLEAETSFITKQPTINRTLISTSESWSSSNNLEIWEEATFETIITLPNWTYNNSSFDGQVYNGLKFLTGSVVSTSWSLSFSTGTWFTSWTNNIDFWTIVNSDTDKITPETIVIHSTYRTETTATTWNKNSRWVFEYDGNNIEKNVVVKIVKPNIVLNKSISPSSWDAWDTLTYTVSMQNNWGANAYDLVLKDTLDSRFTFVTWSLVLNWFSWIESDFLWSNWITLNKLDFGSSTWVTFQVKVNENVAPQDSIPNTANLDYSSLDADNSPNEETYSINSSVNFTVNDISLVHNIISTNNPDTASWKFDTSLYDLALWEEATYKTIISFPESTSTWFVVTQTLPAWYEFLTGSVVNWDLSNSLSWITLSWNIITYTFDPIIINSGSWSKNLELSSTLVVQNTNSAGQEQGLSTLQATWDNSHSKSITTNLDIVEPNLVITKDYDITTWDYWDQAVTTITIINNWTAPAYDLSWTDLQPSDVTTSWNYYSNSWASVLNVWDSITYSYTTTLDNTVTAGQILTWTASIDYTSMPLANSNEKSYNTSDTDNIQVVVAGWLVATLDTSNTESIWWVSSYTIKVPIAEWTTNTLRIEDLLPTWIEVNTGSIVVSWTGITFSGSTEPSFTSTGMIWDFTNVVNSDTNNATPEYIEIQFDTLLKNESVNNAWDTKVHQVKALYNWGNEKNATTQILTVVEPSVSLDITNTYTQANNLVKYTFSLTNTWTSKAYDLDLSTLLPAWVTYTWSLNITNTGWAVNLVKSWNNFTIQELAVNNWNPLTFEIYAYVDDNHSLGENLTLTWNLVYTSQPWNNPDERNGNGWIDDYKTSDTTSFSYEDAILDEKIEVSDDNAGDHLGWETYTYTVTLTNTWNVNLTNITTTINIPNYLSWATFSLQSIPGWATSSYSSTWWINNNWLLTASWINISVWNSVTIVYKIDSLQNTPDGTTITTIAQVSDTPEWAIWWNPEVPLTIIAPKLETTSVETDDNWWNLYKNEIITHKSTIKNIWTATWTNMAVVLTYNTWTVTYISGSLDFASWSLINTGSIVIDENAWTISFIITSIDPNVLEEITFKTKATWNVWDKVKTTISAQVQEWFSSNTTSNELEIVRVPSWWWSSSYSNNYYKKKQKENKKQEEIKKKQEEVNKKKEDEKQRKLKESLIKYYDEYKGLLEKKEKLKEILQEEQKVELWFKIPEFLPKTWTPIEKRVKIINVKSIETELPNKEVFRLAGSNNSDINYWKQVLPEIDQNRDKYLVIPSNWLVIPVNMVPENTADFTKMVSWNEINVNTYLKTWAMEYPNSWKLGKPGNKVIFGHSSYWKKDDWRYKTQFGKIIEMDSWEEVWVYKKINWEFKRFRYKVTKSYNTPAKDVKVLLPTKTSTITLFTCTPIWGIAWRWIIKADYINEEKIKLQNDLDWKNISLKYKRIISKFNYRISKLDKTKQKEIIVKILNKIDNLLKQNKIKNNKKIKDILDYLKMKLIEQLFKK